MVEIYFYCPNCRALFKEDAMQYYIEEYEQHTNCISVHWNGSKLEQELPDFAVSNHGTRCRLCGKDIHGDPLNYVVVYDREKGKILHGNNDKKIVYALKESLSKPINYIRAKGDLTLPRNKPTGTNNSIQYILWAQTVPREDANELDERFEQRIIIPEACL